MHHAARHGSVPLSLVVVIRKRAPFTGSVSAACRCKHLGWRWWHRWCLPSGVLWAGGGEGLLHAFRIPTLWRACSGGSGPFRARQPAHRIAWHGSVPLLWW